jgi:4-phytase / acid phosphatase
VRVGSCWLAAEAQTSHSWKIPAANPQSRATIREPHQRACPLSTSRSQCAPDKWCPRVRNILYVSCRGHPLVCPLDHLAGDRDRLVNAPTRLWYDCSIPTVPYRMMQLPVRLFALVTIFLAAPAVLGAQNTSAPVPKLRFVVILTRHGVRSPTWTPSDLNAYSAEPWPDWGVTPGSLTSHGGKLMTQFGSYYRLYLSAARLLHSTGCEDASHVYICADAESRTHETGRALAAGMMPGCNVEVGTGPDKRDPLFSSLSAGVGKPDPALAAASISGRIGGNPSALVSSYQGAFSTLREVLFGCASATACPAEEKPGKQSILAQASSVEEGKGDHVADLRGPLRIGSTLSEDLQLEYVNGMEGKDLGWGRLDVNKLVEVMRLHTGYEDLTRQTSYVARVQGSNLLSHILRSMEQAAQGSSVTGSLGEVSDRVLVIVGHDTNISNVAGMLGISWLLDGYQRDDTPPGGALVFELWQQAEGDMAVSTYYIAQSLEQMRKAMPLTLETPPLKSPIFIPGCSTAGQKMTCPWKSFQHTIENAIDPSFVKP